MTVQRLGRVAPAGLRRRLVFLVLASVLPFLLLIGMVARRHLLDQKPLAAGRAMAQTQHVAEQLDERLEHMETLMRAVGTSLGASARDRMANDSVLGVLASQIPRDIAGWAIFNRSGALIGKSWADTGGVPPGNVWALWQAHSANGRPVLTEPIDLSKSGRFNHVVRMLVPFRDARGDSAILVARIRARSFRDVLRPTDLPRLPEGSTITVISARGIVLGHVPDTDRWIGRDLSAVRPASSRTGQQNRPRSGTGEYATADGVQRLVAFATLENAPWRVYTGIPMSAVLAQARYSFARAVAYGALALLFAVVLAMWQASRIVDPLRRLSQDAAKLGTGNLSHRSGIMGTDELGVLASTINEMATTLEQQGAVLRESEERYRGLFDINPLPMWVLDPETLDFLAVNRAAVDAYGYSEGEFLGMKVSDIRPPEDVPELRKHLSQTGVAARRYVARHKRKDGTVFQVEIDSGSITFGGRPARLVVVHDVSERVRAEDALRQAESQLRQSQRLEAIGQLTGGIAHDFNNVLTAIGSYSDFLYDSLEPGDARRLDIQEIRKAADRAAGLTKQLLAFSRSQILQPKVIAVNDSLRELESFLKRLLTADIRLEMNLDPESGNVRADPGQMAQVVVNLAVNARDAMPNGGVLTIASRNETVEEPSTEAGSPLAIQPGQYVVVEVSDTGTGMDPETLQRIFEPFFTTKGPGEGTGLGLATVYGIVIQSEGHIAARSEVGVGTTFTIRLPRVHMPVEAERPKAERASAGSRSETILVVEDEEAVRRAATRILIKKGYSVLEAADGDEAIALVRSGKRIDLLLTDLVMPGMGGRELVRVMREEGRLVPTLYMSGYTKDAVMRAELDPEIMVLEKPFSHGELSAKVREALNKSAG